MRKKIQEAIFGFAYVLEVLISIIVAFSVVVLSFRLFMSTINSTLFGAGDDILVGILDNAMILAIGVEFIKMLCRHTPETVIEVLLFAIARQLVIVHSSPLENLITIVSVAILLATRKYLLRDGDSIAKRLFAKKQSSEENKEQSA